MSFPVPKDGDARGPAPQGPSKRQARDADDRKTADEQWSPVPGKPGYSINSAGRLKYSPFLDPSHPLYRAMG